MAAMMKADSNSNSKAEMVEQRMVSARSRLHVRRSMAVVVKKIAKRDGSMTEMKVCDDGCADGWLNGWLDG